MTTTVTYTDYEGNKVNSSVALKELVYDENTKTLTVQLRDSRDVWSYSGVPSEVWEKAKATDSVGRFYGRVIKKNYGPGTKVGTGYGISFRKVSKTRPVTPRQTVGTPKALIYVTPAAPVKGGKRSMTVSFEVNGRKGSSNSDYTDVDAAVAEVTELFKALGLVSKITDVTVHFE
jgi:hypothetical protein